MKSAVETSRESTQRGEISLGRRGHRKEWRNDSKDRGGGDKLMDLEL